MTQDSSVTLICFGFAAIYFIAICLCIRTWARRILRALYHQERHMEIIEDRIKLLYTYVTNKDAEDLQGLVDNLKAAVATATNNHNQQEEDKE